MNDKQPPPAGPEFLEQCEDNWRTAMGSIVIGEDAILRGKSVLYDFDDSSWMEYFLFGITGKTLKTYSKFLEGVWRLTTSYPDPRLWNNRVAALAGTTRSTGVLAAAAGIAVSEATNYGLRPIKGSVDFLYRAEREICEGKSIPEIVNKELKKHRSVYGYGRPLADRDERVAPMLGFAQSLGMEEGKYLRLAFDIESYLKTTRLKYSINVAGVVAGLVADQGRTPEEHYYMGILSFVAGMFPCYIDALNQREGSFFPLTTERINYIGYTAEDGRSWLRSDTGSK